MSKKLVLTAAVLALAMVITFSCKKKAPAGPGTGTAAPAGPVVPNMGPAVQSTAPATGMVELKIEYPKPRFVGTPKNIKEKNLQPADFVPPAVMAPEGTSNLALNKKVTASDMLPIVGELTQIVDGEKEAVDGNFVEFMGGKQWVQVDLGAPAEIWAVALWHSHSTARVYHDVIIQLSNDPEFIKDVTTIFNNDYDNTLGLGVGNDYQYLDSNKGKVVDAKGAKAQYVRLYSNGNSDSDVNHYTEVEVWGKALP